MYRGELIICGYARTKTDRDAYRKAVAEFHRRKAEIDAGVYDKELVRQQKLAKRQAKKASSSLTPKVANETGEIHK